MDVRLVVRQNGKRVRVIHLKPPQAIVGRGSGNAVRIPSADVSRRHCRIRFKDGFVTVEDLESVNGTYVNGTMIKGEQVVRPGDHLEIGPVEFIVEYRASAEVMARLDGEEEPEMLVVDDDEEPEMLELDEDAMPTIRPPREEDDQLIPLEEGEDLAPRERVLSDDERLQLPDAGQLRDILSQMDDAEEEAPKPTRPVKEKKKPNPKREEGGTRSARQDSDRSSAKKPRKGGRT